jgi:hypothetical protein
MTSEYLVLRRKRSENKYTHTVEWFDVCYSNIDPKETDF